MSRERGNVMGAIKLCKMKIKFDLQNCCWRNGMQLERSREMIRKLMMALASVVATCGVWAETPTITGVTAKQRYPWNGKVDITYTVTGCSGVASGTKPVLLVSATNRVAGTSYTALATALAGDTDMAEGTHHVVWDLNAQGLEFKSEDVVFTVAYATLFKQYCVIDLSDGANAASYPVTYMDESPSGGFNTDEYKTTKLVLRLIEPGTFMMGGSYQVTLTKPFYCGLFEVTQRQWELVMGGNPCSTTSYGKGNSYPVHYVSYNMIRGLSNGAQWPSSSAVDSSSFIGNLRAKTGLSDFDLPMEAQWEYACRAGTTTTYYWGNSMDGSYCWYPSNSSMTTHPVGGKTANAWGLYDMSGNVWEWCLDRYGNLTSGVTDPVGASTGSYRVIRGGGWNNDVIFCTSSYRDDYDPSYGNFINGFRLVRTLSN